MELDQIIIKGAAEHNLKGIDVSIPKKKLVVLTGVSGSGKSSLAFDTLFAEGQRRYVESLSAYARQFLGQMEKPRYDSIRGLSPTISIEQKTASRSPRSTVGTVTEILDYLRVLWARVGVQHCHICGKPVGRQSAEEIVSEIAAMPEGTRFELLSPVVVNRKGEHRELLAGLLKQGFTRVRIDGDTHRLEELPELDKKKKHTIHVVVDRLVIRADMKERLTDSVETALKAGSGVVEVAPRGGEARVFSEHLSCCGHAFQDLTPPVFSFNSPLGMCPSCSGLGRRLDVDPDLIVPDHSLTLGQGAIKPWKKSMERASGWQYRLVLGASQARDIPLDVPWRDLPKAQRSFLLYGSRGALITVTWEGERGKGEFKTTFEGIIPTISRRYRETQSGEMRKLYLGYMAEAPCSSCQGMRLRPESLAVRVGGLELGALCRMNVRQAIDAIDALELDGARKMIAGELLKEVQNRLLFLANVGLEYLTLDRPSATLSGGESQRIRLASQIGSELTGVTYILDEPSIGLHQRDNRRLLGTLKHLRDIGNSVVVVEHDQETIEEADWVIDFGPGAGRLGGQVVYAGPPSAFPEQVGITATGDFVTGKRAIEAPETRRSPGKDRWIGVDGASENNLRHVDLRIPLGCLVAVTGVSGAGKSSLINAVLRPALARHLHKSEARVGRHDRLVGLDRIDKVIAIDQQPIGRTPRSNPATYTKLWDLIRQVFASTKEAKVRGYKAGRFSFNVKGGRCESCKGDGYRKIEMHFLADVLVPCDACGGKRFNEATLQVRHRGKNIAEVLAMTIEEAIEHFANHRKIVRILQTLMDVGLSYLSLGQPSTTLSGGEAQRIKLSRQLARVATGDTLYLLDEPTTGLHFSDIQLLVKVLQRLADAGNTVVVIEHNLDVIKCADWVIDLGPEGGDGGGLIVAEGPPETVAAVEGSHTGRYLRPLLGL